MAPVNLRLRILAPLALLLLVLFAIFVVGVYREESEHIEKEFSKLQQSVAQVYAALVSAQAGKLGAAAQAVMADPRLQHAMEAADRTGLLALTEPLFQTLRSDYGITHLYFHGPDRVNRLRVHQSERHGDLIDRFTALDAEANGRLAHGIELGPLGTFTLRAVAPWQAQGRLLGYVELGEEIDALAGELRAMFAAEIYVLISKDYLVRKNWYEGMSMLGRAPHWDLLDRVVVAGGPGALPEPLLVQLASGRPGQAGEPAQTSYQGRVYRSGIIEVEDAGGRVVGGLLLVQEATERLGSLYRTLAVIGGVFFVCGLGLLGVFHVVLGRVERQLVSTHEQVIEEGRVREALQDKHIGELERLALYDTLTGLPNRQLLQDRLEHAIAIAHRDREPFALLLVDLHRVREINDTLGYAVGDKILRQVASRLQSALRRSDTVARHAGVEFAVLMRDVDRNYAIYAAEKIQQVLDEPFDIDDVPLDIEVSIGIAIYPDHAADAQTLVQRADVAMRNARRTQHGFVVYEVEQDPYNMRRLSLYGHLRRAIKNDELTLHYQPKLDMKTGAIKDVEALLRWQHYEYGAIPPGEFVPLAERTAMVGPLTAWVIGAALRQCRDWRRAGLDLRVAVNLSVRNLLNPDLPREIGAVLDDLGMDPDSLVLEITESAIMEEPKRALPVLTQLHEMGLALSIDDFGTGYSSLAYLKRIPAEELKIDQSFVFGMLENDNDAVIVRSTIDLAHNLGLRVVAEGVENRAALDRLEALGCDIVQGYYISRPLPALRVTEFLRQAPWGAQS